MISIMTHSIQAVVFSKDDIAQIKSSLPEMPASRLARYTGEFELSETDSALLVGDKALSDFYDHAVSAYHNPKGLASFVLGELLRRLNLAGIGVDRLSFSPEDVASLVKMSDDGMISKNAAKDIFRILFEEGGKPQEIAKAHGFIMDTDTGAVESAIQEILAENPKAVAEFRQGSDKVFGFLMGQASRKMGKGANPQVIRETLTKLLNGG
jgi:aspartyl-tRNA(Asn)/glutamyl-tRNA(Gln) amidotransferase subunit B